MREGGPSGDRRERWREGKRPRGRRTSKRVQRWESAWGGVGRWKVTRRLEHGWDDVKAEVRESA